MKKLMILGALIGFSAGLLLGTQQGASWPDVLWRSIILCAASSYLFRWWGRTWLQALRQAQEQRLELASSESAPPAKV